MLGQVKKSYTFISNQIKGERESERERGGERERESERESEREREKRPTSHAIIEPSSPPSSAKPLVTAKLTGESAPTPAASIRRDSRQRHHPGIG